MLEVSVPLLNAQQQGMAPLVATTARAEVAAQASQSIVSNLIDEESKKLAPVDNEKESDNITDRKEGSGGSAGFQERQKKEPENNVETAPSYHNPLAGYLFSEKV